MNNEYLPDPSEAALPPHAPEMEVGVLGCIFLDSRTVLPKVREQFGEQGRKAFYDLRHQVIYDALCRRADGPGGIEVITIRQDLKDRGEYDQAGGDSYVPSLPDLVPSAANFEFYLAGVWEKFLARQLIADARRRIRAVTDLNGVNETLIGALGTQHEEFLRQAQRGSITPVHLKPPAAFGEAAMEHFFGASRQEAPGHEMAIPFPMKWRRKEMTLLFGDDGSGKSTILSYLLLHILQHPGEKAVVASFEVPPDVTLWMLAAQLLGQKAFWETDTNRKTIAGAIAWLNARVEFYDFQGIADWREVRDTFRYAAEKNGARWFTIDNAMRMGIADDDYAQQGLAASTLATFAKEMDGHVIIVLHENKGEGKGKSKIRGSKLWSANMHNVLSVRINAEKQMKIDKEEFLLAGEKMRKEPDQSAIAECEKEIAKLKSDWDTELLLHKQRYPGTRQNASKRIWFDRQCFQFRNHYHDPAVNWLTRWKEGQ